MSVYTRLGTAVWSWEPFKKLPVIARYLWLALYTTPQGKAYVPGIVVGGVHTIADAAHLPYDETWSTMDLLLERELVEYDTRACVLRLCELPDGGETIWNANSVRGWWNRFRLVPVCGVRDAHVGTLWWIIERGFGESNKTVPHPIADAWKETFGTIEKLPTRRRGVRRRAAARAGRGRARRARR